jgi:hypothetical protein
MKDHQHLLGDAGLLELESGPPSRHTAPLSNTCG